MQFQPPELAPLTVTLSQATIMSGLSRSTLLRRADEGELKTVSVSNRRLVVVESLKKMLGLSEKEAAA